MQFGPVWTSFLQFNPVFFWSCHYQQLVAVAVHQNRTKKPDRTRPLNTSHVDRDREEREKKEEEKEMTTGLEMHTSSPWYDFFLLFFTQLILLFMTGFFSN